MEHKIILFDSNIESGIIPYSGKFPDYYWIKINYEYN